MATKKLHPRIYEREYASGNVRYWADFRDYEDVGGGQEALKPEGSKRATTDPEIANTLVSRRLEELQEARRHRVQTGIRKAYGLKEFAALHLERKARGDISERWMEAVENHLERAVAFFGADTELSSIRPPQIHQWVEELRNTSNGRGRRCPECDELGDLVSGGPRVECPECGHTWRGGTLSEKTVRDHIDSVSNLYRRAQGEEAVPQGYNPVQAWLGSIEDNEKPTDNSAGREAEWFEPEEAAMLLEAARTYEPPEKSGAHDFIHELMATALLTGGRKAEVLGLEVRDLSFDREVIRFRENEHRGLKTKTSTRTVPMWPQLKDILQSYIFDPERAGPTSGLLFPSPKRPGKMLKNARNQLDQVGKRVGFEKGEVRLQKLRHTYTAARIQTTEHGAPVALFTVARELGHSSTKLIERRYGHLLQNRSTRGEEVEFRVESHLEELGEERINALKAAK